jgi:hypothetical protein
MELTGEKKVPNMSNRLGAIILVMSVLLCGSAQAMDWRDSPLNWRNSGYRWHGGEWKKSPLNWRNSGYRWHKSKWRGNRLNWRNSGYRWHKSKWRGNRLNWRNSGYLWQGDKWKKGPLYWRNSGYRWDVSPGSEDQQEINLRLSQDLGKDLPGASGEVKKTRPQSKPKIIEIGEGEKTSESFKESTTHSESTEWYIAVSGSNGTDGIYWHTPPKNNAIAGDDALVHGLSTR